MQNEITLSIENIHPFVRYVNLLQCKPGFNTGFRKLYNYYFLYVHKGKGMFTMEDRSFDAVAGDLFFCRPGVPNAIAADNKDPFLLTGVDFDFTCNNCHKKNIYPVQADLFEPAHITELVGFTDFEGFPDKISLADDNHIRTKLCDMADKYNLKKSHWNQYINGIFLSVIILVAQRIEQQSYGMQNTYKGDDIIQFLTENYMNTLSNTQIAARFHYHHDYISKIVYAYTGMTLKQYIIDLRIKAALDLLIHSDIDIANIACACGYDNLQYFYRVFKSKVGISPGYFRRVRK